MAEIPGVSYYNIKGNKSMAIITNKDGKPAKSIITIKGNNGNTTTYIISPGIDIKTIEDKSGKVISHEEIKETEADIVYGRINPIEEEALLASSGIFNAFLLTTYMGYNRADKLRVLLYNLGSKPYDPSTFTAHSWTDKYDMAFKMAINEEINFNFIGFKLLHDARVKASNNLNWRQLFLANR